MISWFRRLKRFTKLILNILDSLLQEGSDVINEIFDGYYVSAQERTILGHLSLLKKDIFPTGNIFKSEGLLVECFTIPLLELFV